MAEARKSQSAVRRFLEQSGVYGIGRFAGVGLSALLIPVYLHYLTAEAYSVLVVAQALSPVLAGLFTLNLEAAGARFYFEFHGVERCRFMGTLFTVARAQSVLVCCLAALTVPWWIRWLGSPLIEPIHVELTLAQALFQSLTVLPALLFRMQEKPRRFVAATLLPAVIGAALSIWFLTGLEWGVTGVLAGQLVGTALGAPVALFMARDQITPAFELQRLRQAMRYLLPLTPEYLLGSLVNSLDRFVLGRFVSPEIVGQYGVARQLSNIVRNCLTAIKTAHTPMAFRLWRERPGGDREAIVRISNVMFLSVLVAVFAAAAGGALMLAWFGGEEYARAIDYLPLSLLPPVFTGLYFIYSVSDLVRDEPHAAFWSWVASVFVVAIGLATLVPSFGAEGALWAVAIGQALRAGIAWCMAERETNIGFPNGRYFGLSVMVTMLVAMPGWGPLLLFAGAFLLLLAFFWLIPRELRWMKSLVLTRVGWGGANGAVDCDLPREKLTPP